MIACAICRKRGRGHPREEVVSVSRGMGCITWAVATGLGGRIGIGKTGQQSGREIIGPADALIQRIAGLGRIGAHIEWVVALGGGVAERVDFLIDLAGVIPVGMAADEAVAGIEPMAYRGQVSPNRIRRNTMLGRNVRGRQVLRFVVGVVGFRHAVAVAILDDDRSRQIQQVGGQIAAVDLPHVAGIGLAQQWPRSARAPVIHFF